MWYWSHLVHKQLSFRSKCLLEPCLVVLAMQYWSVSCSVSQDWLSTVLAGSLSNEHGRDEEIKCRKVIRSNMSLLIVLPLDLLSDISVCSCKWWQFVCIPLQSHYLDFYQHVHTQQGVKWLVRSSVLYVASLCKKEVWLWTVCWKLYLQFACHFYKVPIAVA